MKTWLVTGYTKTGVYSEVVEAKTSTEALKKGKPLVKAMSKNGKKFVSWVVRDWE